jgi:TonB family protein
MDLLTLEGVPPPSVTRPTRAEAVMASVIAHLLVFLLLVYSPDQLPERIRRLLGLEASPTTAQSSPAPDARAAAEAEKAERERRAQEKRIPLQFAYVRVPDDRSSAKNPEAHLLSDKDRRARQEVPTPPDASRFTRDPHAEGNSRDRIRIDPSRPEGPDALDPVPPPAGARRASGGSGSAASRSPGPVQRPPAAEPGATQGAGPGERLAERPREEPPGQAGGSAALPGDGGEEGPSREETEGPPGEPSRQAQQDPKAGTEYKFSFSNPGWLRGQAYGTLSFDTQGFPWGEYARQLYVIIRNNWLARIPLAAREGIAGYTCQHFVIARGGEISDIEIVRSSSIPPFNKAAGDALRASSPLPPLPEEFPDPREGVTFCFFYNMYPGEAD